MREMKGRDEMARMLFWKMCGHTITDLFFFKFVNMSRLLTSKYVTAADY
jgi:hypothetical protein